MDEKKNSQSTETDMKELAFQLFLDSLPSLNDTDEHQNNGDPHWKIAGIIPATDEERLELMQKRLNLSVEESKELLDKMNARQKEQRPTWDDFFSVESREEKIALLDKMFGGSLTPEEIERFLAIE